MSAVNYSKWDNIEISDDEDIECHPNIDKASWVRMMQRKIHQEREDRRLKIAQMQAEHTTNIQLKEKMIQLNSQLTQMSSEDGRKLVEKLLKDIDTFERDRKPKLMDQNSPEYMQIKDVDEVTFMLYARLLQEAKVDRKTDKVLERLPSILTDELPKLDKRQAELVRDIAKEQKEQNKKLTSENILKEGFSKTVINPKTEQKQQKKKETTIEVLNSPKEQKLPEPKPQATQQKQQSEPDLRELSLQEEKMMLDFANCQSFEDSYKFIQQHSDIVSREYSDHLMARAFKCQMDGRSAEAFKCVRWSLALNYCLSMGRDGPGLFFQRMTKNGPQPVAMFEQDVKGTFEHVVMRAKALNEKNASKDVDESNSNLTPEQAVAFKSFPKHFQDALYSGDMDLINKSFARMPKEESDRIMAECQKTGLISVLSEEEANAMIEKDKEQAVEQ